jgi:hypothetical protein
MSCGPAIKASLGFIPAFTSPVEGRSEDCDRLRKTRPHPLQTARLSPSSPVLSSTSKSQDSFLEKEWKGATRDGLEQDPAPR